MQKNKITLCLFDCGGVVYPYTLEPFKKFVQSEFLKGKGVCPSFAWNALMSGEFSFEEFCKDICEKSNVQCTKKTVLKIDDVLHQGVGPVYDDILESIHFLKSRGVKIGMLSNALPCLKDTINSLPLDRDFVFLSYELKMLKPDERIFKKVQALSGVPFNEILFVDDKIENVNVASKLGIKTILYNQKNVLNSIRNLCGDNHVGYTGYRGCYSR